MTKPRAAAQAQEVPAPLVDAASGVFRHLGEASWQLMELQVLVWLSATLGSQAVVGAAWMQTALMTFRVSSRAGSVAQTPERRTGSIVIQFPDRRRSGRQ